jgi:hypothetical protein
MNNRSAIFILFMCIIVISLISIILENNNAFEGFKNLPSIGRGTGIGGVGYDLDYSYSKPKNSDKFGNMRYPGRAYLGIVNGKNSFSYDNPSDDSQLSFDFISLNNIF